MNYSPDYSMRSHNQSCGCRQNPPRSTTAPVRPVFQECSRDLTARTPASCCTRPEPVAECPCKNTTVILPKTPEKGCCPEPRSHSRCIDTFPIGMTYTPWQVWQELYEIDTALAVGTIFRELDYPWEVGRCVRGR